MTIMFNDGEVAEAVRGVEAELRKVYPAVFVEAEAAGSAAIFDAGEDIDVIALLPGESDLHPLIETGWAYGGSEPAIGQGAWHSFRKGPVNLIVVTEADYYQRWQAATRLCQYLGVLVKNKGARCAVHAIVMDGFTADTARALEAQINSTDLLP